MNSSFFTLLHSPHVHFFFQLNSYRTLGEIAETQSTDWVRHSAWNRRFANNNWQRRVYFGGEFSWTHLFSPYYTHHTSIFFKLNSYRTLGEVAETQSTDWVRHSALDRHVARNNWQRWVYFHGEFSWTHLFSPYYTHHTSIFYQLNGYRSTGEIAETQSTDWVWHSVLDCHVAKNNWQRRVYFRGEFSWTHLFWPYYTQHMWIFFI